MRPDIRDMQKNTGLEEPGTDSGDLSDYTSAWVYNPLDPEAEARYMPGTEVPKLEESYWKSIQIVLYGF